MQLIAPTTAASAQSADIELETDKLPLPNLNFCYTRGTGGSIQIFGRNHPSHGWVANGVAVSSSGVFTRPPTRFVRAVLTGGAGTNSLDVFL